MPVEEQEAGTLHAAHPLSKGARSVTSSSPTSTMESVGRPVSPFELMTRSCVQTEAILSVRREHEIAAEMAALRAASHVSGPRMDECPVCLSHFQEQPYPAARIPRGAFLCRHAVCCECTTRLLCIACERINVSTDGTAHGMRCPLCRAPMTPVGDAPPWLRELMCGDEIAAARQRRESTTTVANTAVREAMEQVVMNIAALQRVIFTQEADDATTFRLEQAIMSASEIVVEAVEEADGEADGEWVHGQVEDSSTAGSGVEDASPDMTTAFAPVQDMTGAERMLLMQAEIEAEMGVAPSERISAFMHSVAAAYYPSQSLHRAGQRSTGGPE